MLATDHHIGYLERDPIRGMDAINTFKEILQLAVKHDVRRHCFSASLFSIKLNRTVLLVE
jgi:double-strand break repair protein MRE11